MQLLEPTENCLRSGDYSVRLEFVGTELSFSFSHANENNELLLKCKDVSSWKLSDIKNSDKLFNERKNSENIIFDSIDRVTEQRRIFIE